MRAKSKVEEGGREGCRTGLRKRRHKCVCVCVGGGVQALPRDRVMKQGWRFKKRGGKRYVKEKR